jgi:hypothetical protein
MIIFCLAIVFCSSAVSVIATIDIAGAIATIDIAGTIATIDIAGTIATIVIVTTAAITINIVVTGIMVASIVVVTTAVIASIVVVSTTAIASIVVVATAVIGKPLVVPPLVIELSLPAKVLCVALGVCSSHLSSSLPAASKELWILPTFLSTTFLLIAFFHPSSSLSADSRYISLIAPPHCLCQCSLRIALCVFQPFIALWFQDLLFQALCQRLSCLGCLCCCLFSTLLGFLLSLWSRVLTVSELVLRHTQGRLGVKIGRMSGVVPRKRQLKRDDPKFSMYKKCTTG